MSDLKILPHCKIGKRVLAYVVGPAPKWITLVGGHLIDEKEAKALRDWLNKVLPSPKE